MTPARQPPAAPRPGCGLRLRGLRRVFGARTVIEGLDLDIAPGEFLALLGPSGCGKSTLLRLIAGLDQPDGGLLQRHSGEPSLAYVFQDASLMPWRTVLGNVALPLELAGVGRSGREAAAHRLLATVGLADAAGRFPAELSGGMRMRVSLARALITQPSLLLLDEPFAALDEFTRQHLDEHLQQIWLARRMTVIFVTHAIGEAVFLADRVAVLAGQGGRLLADRRLDLPRPRPPELRTTAGFVDEVQALSRLLRGDGERP